MKMKKKTDTMRKTTTKKGSTSGVKKVKTMNGTTKRIKRPMSEEIPCLTL